MVADEGDGGKGGLAGGDSSGELAVYHAIRASGRLRPET